MKYWTLRLPTIVGPAFAVISIPLCFWDVGLGIHGGLNYGIFYYILNIIPLGIFESVYVYSDSGIFNDGFWKDASVIQGQIYLAAICLVFWLISAVGLGLIVDLSTRPGKPPQRP